MFIRCLPEPGRAHDGHELASAMSSDTSCSARTTWSPMRCRPRTSERASISAIAGACVRRRARHGRRGRGAAAAGVTTPVITVAPFHQHRRVGRIRRHDQLGHDAVADAQAHGIGTRLAVGAQQVQPAARGLAAGQVDQQLLVAGLLLRRQLVADQRAHVGEDAVARLSGAGLGRCPAPRNCGRCAAMIASTCVACAGDSFSSSTRRRRNCPAARWPALRAARPPGRSRRRDGLARGAAR